MKRFFPLAVGAIIIALAIVFQKPAEPAMNPDPNHTHADFAVWVNGEKLDFSGEAFMSGSASDDSHERALHPYLHLHDGIGHVIHRHKSDLALGQFLGSVGLGIWVPSTPCLEGVPVEPEIVSALDNVISEWPEKDPLQTCLSGPLKMFVNGQEISPDPDYIFKDLDQILLTDANDQTEIDRQLEKMTNDACLYSRTCPERGDPPTENCIADPAVPCVIPE